MVLCFLEPFWYRWCSETLRVVTSDKRIVSACQLAPGASACPVEDLLCLCLIRHWRLDCSTTVLDMFDEVFLKEPGIA
jgi:hypothetical protein